MMMNGSKMIARFWYEGLSLSFSGFYFEHLHNLLLLVVAAVMMRMKIKYRENGGSGLNAVDAKVDGGTG